MPTIQACDIQSNKHQIVRSKVILACHEATGFQATIVGLDSVVSAPGMPARNLGASLVVELESPDAAAFEQVRKEIEAIRTNSYEG